MVAVLVHVGELGPLLPIGSEAPNLAKFHISPHLLTLCGKTEIPLHVEKFHVLKSEISPHVKFFLHLHVGDRGDKYQVC